METARIIQTYLAVLIWPCVVTLALVLYRDVIRSLLPGSKVKMTILGIEIETTLPIIEQSISESFHGKALTQTQRDWLRDHKDGNEAKFDRSQLDILRPLRNAGLITNYPAGYLGDATSVRITALGKVVAEASEKQRVER